MTSEFHSDTLVNASVLVTGGTGFLGQLLVAQLAQSGARRIRVAGRNTQRYTVPNSSASCELEFVSADIEDTAAVRGLVSGVDLVFHLAAIKDLSECERDPISATRVNVVGAINVVSAALREPQVQGLVAVSSDKASAPTSVLGMTKALMERIVARASDGGSRAYGCVRLGSVWGSTGSVVDRWRTSAAKHHSIDVTDPKMTRFLLAPDCAVRMLISAASAHLAGEVMVPITRAYRVGDLAEAFQEIHGGRVRVIGRRPGEKMHEDLVSVAESARTVGKDGFYLVGERHVAKPVMPFNSAMAEKIPRNELARLIVDR